MSKVNPKISAIGSRVQVDLPTHNIFNVPAKVDTGADSSSIWASNVQEHKGTLVLTLFDKDSVFFTGQIITTRQFKIRSIKNSFGRTEFRYKVPLQAVVEGRKIRVWFTLANREDNRYPILIGRRTLQGKFLVDVAKNKSIGKNSAKENQVLVLVNSGGPKIRRFYQQLNKEMKGEVHTTVEKYRDIVCYVENNKLQVYVRGDSGEKKFEDFSLIYFKTSAKNAQLAALLASHAKRLSTPFIDTETIKQPSQSKLFQLVRLQQAGVRVPNTIFMSNKKLEGAYKELSEKLGLPFILKDNYGKKSRDIHLIKSRRDFEIAIRVADTSQTEMIAQSFIRHEVFYRVLVLSVLGPRVELVIKKAATVGRAPDPNRPKASLLSVNKFPSAAVMMSVRAAEALGLQVAGVDIAQDKKTGLWQCFEVNNSPQLVAGAFVEKKRAALAKLLYSQARGISL